MQPFSANSGDTKQYSLDTLFRYDDRSQVFAVEAGDVGNGDFGGARGFAFVGVGATSEALFIHLSHHASDSAGAFWFTLWEQCEL